MKASVVRPDGFALLALMLLNFLSLSNAKDIFINWVIPFGNPELPSVYANVGDTLVFQWDGPIPHNVALNTGKNCDFTNAISLSGVSPVGYFVSPADVGEKVFVCTIPGHCAAGQILSVFVAAAVPPPTFAPPTLPPPTFAPPTLPPPTFAPPTLPPPTFAPPTLPPPTFAPPTLPPPTFAPLPTFAPPTPFVFTPPAPTPRPIVVVPAPTPSPPVLVPVPFTSAPTPSPTRAPTVPPTAAPTDSPTLPPVSLAPTFALTDDLITNLAVTLEGVSLPLDGIARSFEAGMKAHCESFFNSNMEALAAQVDDYETIITVNATRTLPVGRRSLRELQETVTVQVIYNQALRYRADADEMDLRRVILAPLSTDARLKAFVDALKATRNPAFQTITASGEPEPGPTEEELAADLAAQEKSGLSQRNIIIIAVVVGLVVLLCLVVLAVLCCRKEEGSSSGAANKATSDAGPAGHGDQSVNTVDYDYSKAYGGGGDVSAAGGTLGDNTRGTTGLTAGAGAAVGGASMFSQDKYKEGNLSVQEEMIEVYAPPGKLGVVIDTPDEGAPVVHAIKDSSCIADQIKVGDKLIAVDDEDVRAMTAIKVSKMISRKSANPTRKLTIVRTTVSD